MAETSDGVVIVGLEKTIKALKEYDKGALRRFNAIINEQLGEIERDSRRVIDFVGNSSGTSAPMRGWVTTYGPVRPTTSTRGGAGWPAWVPGSIKQGIRKSRVQGKVRPDYTTSAGAVINKSPAGVIFEVAGRRSSGRGVRGQQFIRNLRQWGRASRLVWRIVDRDRQKVVDAVVKAQREANQMLQKRLDQAGR